MKRLAFLFFLLPVSLVAQIIDIPDTEFKRILTQTTVVYDDIGRSGAIGDVDINNDGEIDMQEAQSVEHLFIEDGTGVNELSGLEHFVNLQSVFLKRFEISEFSFHSFSVLKQFEIEKFKTPKLNIANLDSLKAVSIATGEIDSIVLQNNPQLLIMLMRTSGIINDIYLSDLPRFESVQAGFNGIESIRFRNTPILSELNLRNNLLEELDCSKLPELEIVSCQENPSLKELNIQNGARESRGDVRIWNNNALERICVDGFQKSEIESLVSELGLSAEVLSDCVVSNEEVSKTSPLVYPNPTTDFIYFPDKNLTKIELYNQLGVLVKQINHPVSPINVGALQIGMYALRLFSDEKSRSAFFEKI